MSFILYNAPPSTCSQRVRFVLNAKALPFEERKLDLLAGDQLKPDYLALNPNGVVPTLDHDGTTSARIGRGGTCRACSVGSTPSARIRLSGRPTIRARCCPSASRI
jgi:hypothetical protein